MVTISIVGRYQLKRDTTSAGFKTKQIRRAQ